MSHINTSNGNFGEGKISSLIMSQAVPLTMAQLVQVIYNVVDRMYIGHMPGDAAGVALTGVGVTFPLITLVAAFTNLFATGGAPLCAIARGQGDNKKAKNIEAQTFTMQILVGLAIMCLLYIVKKPALYLLGASDITYGYANSYISIYLIGTVFMMVGTGMNGFINLQGFPKIGMFSTMLGAAVNIVLDPVFIFVLGFGVWGAAVATVISQFCSACFVTCFLFGRKVIIHITVADMLKLDFKLLKEIVTLGMSGFIMAITNSLVQMVCNASLQAYGGDIYVGVMTVINSVREVAQMPVNGITNSAQPIISFNYGAKEPARVRQAIRYMSGTLILYTAAAWAMLWFFPSFFIRIFNQTPALIETGVPAMRIYFFGYFMMALQFCGQSVFTALGKSKHAIFFSIFRKAVIVVPLILILPHCFGLNANGVFLAEPISNFIGGAACFITMLLSVYFPLKRMEAKTY